MAPISRPFPSSTFVLLVCLAFGAWADVPPEQEAEVEHLINYLAESDCRMLRNGKSYNSFAEAQLMQSRAVGSTSRRAGAMSSPHSWQ